ncbi:hypothetical protein AC579_7910 [Pseudocercospora musae]|uniref:Uncharacterized protein n=1 Tax=Pseudocercospora musae TaxID=113226 RepID=A0A139IET3_9PEZI|nr:hypothetical protein AC579_7910 [Pseudocercospora musae]
MSYYCIRFINLCRSEPRTSLSVHMDPLASSGTISEISLLEPVNLASSNTATLFSQTITQTAMATDSELWARGPAEFIKQQIADQKKSEKKRIQECHVAGVLDGVHIIDFAATSGAPAKAMSSSDDASQKPPLKPRSAER